MCVGKQITFKFFKYSRSLGYKKERIALQKCERFSLSLFSSYINRFIPQL